MYPGYSSSQLKSRCDRQLTRKRRNARSKSSSPPPSILVIPDELALDHETDFDIDNELDLVSASGEAGSDAKKSPLSTLDVDAYTSDLCPWCGDEVDGRVLQEFSEGKRLNVRMQSRFCQSHKREKAMATWRVNHYPQIDWRALTSRFRGHRDFLLDIVNGHASYFRGILASRIESGAARSLKKEDNLNPGYYGPRGFNIMCDFLVTEFGDLLKRKAIEDPVIAGRGSAAFIQCVLVAELAVQLIMEDLGVPQEEAQDIMEETKELGEVLHGDS